MKIRVKEKDTAKPVDQLQDVLEQLLSDVSQEFFGSSRVKKFKLKGYQAPDILSGALITLFTKHLAFLSAQENQFDHETYLQGIFDAMSQLFAKHREYYVEVLKDKDEKNSSEH